MRGRLSILVIATALAVGLWYLFAPPDPPDVTRSDPDAPVSRPAPAVDDPDTADAGSEPAPDTAQTKETAADSTVGGDPVAEVDADSATDIAQTSEPGATAESDDTLAAGSDSDSTTDVARTSEPDATPREGDTLAAGSGSDSTTDVAQTSEPGATLRQDDTLAAGSGSDSTSESAQTSESVAMAAPEVAPAFGTGAMPPADGVGTAQSDAAEAEPRPATGSANRPATAEVVLAPATDGAIERTPIAPAGTPPEDAADPVDVLAAVAGGIERITNAIEETLGIEPEEDADTALRLRIEYDDTPTDAPQTGLGPKEDAEAVAADATAAADVAQTSETGATLRADDTLAAGSGSDSTTDVARISEPDATPREDDAPAAGSGSDPTTDVAQTTEPGATLREDDTLAAGSDSTTESAQTSESVAMAAPEVAPAFGTGAMPPADGVGTAQSDAAEAEPRPATGSANRPATAEVVLAPATDGAIERTPIAPAGTPPEDAADPVDVLAAVAGGIERLTNAIEETLGVEPEEDADTALRLRIEYDDTPTDAPQTGLGPKEDAEAIAADAAADVAQTTDTGTGSPADPALAIASDGTPSTPPLQTADSDGTAPSRVDQTADAGAIGDAGATGDEGTGAEAKQYVETLTATTPPTIPVDKADHFVTQDSMVSLVPEDSIESTTIGDLAGDDTLTPDTPITVVREVEQIETAVPEQLIADSGGDLDRPLRIVVTYEDSQQIDKPSSTGEDAAEQGDATADVIAEDTSEPIAATKIAAAEDTSAPEADEQRGVEEVTVREALERMRTEPEKPLSIVRTVRHFEVMTLRELLDSQEDDDAFLNVVLRPYRIEAATLADLLRLHKTESRDTISYLHTVQPTDDQGIWGIVHFGLIENFARGMAVRRGEEIETYTVQIPRDADERLEDRSSSFLGKLIDRKTKESYVYNYRENRMGRNPDVIYPGQEIVIINFEPGELEAIYAHFAGG